MKKFLILILTVILAVCVLSGCGSKTEDADNSEASITITDMTGRTVEVPKTVEKIVPLGNAPRMITYLGLADKAVGIGSMSFGDISPVTAYAYANKDLWADLPIVGTDAAGATDYYPEQIIALAPDVIFCSYSSELADEIQSKTGVPTVAVAMGTLFAEDYEEALRLIAEVCSVQDRAEEVISFIDGCLEDLAKRTADVPEEGKPSVLGAAATFKGAHGIEGVYSKYQVFEAIAANDVTTGISDTVGGVLIDKEQVLGWNPQYIFLDNGGVALVRQDFSVMPDFYNQLQAVVKGDVYQYPSSTSYYSNVEIPIANSYYVGSLLYPQEFKDINFEEKANEIFKFFLGTDDYLKVLNESGSGYGKIELGE